MTPAELKTARAALALSQADMARALGLGSASRVAEYENGTRRPSGAALILYRVYLLKPSLADDVIEARI